MPATFMFCVGHCCACGALMTFNPVLVPSIRGRYVGERFLPDPSGDREPVCRPCAEKFNRIRQAKGLSETPIHSHAYTEEEVA